MGEARRLPDTQPRMTETDARPMVSCLTHRPMPAWSCPGSRVVWGDSLVAISRIWVDEEILCSGFLSRPPCFLPCGHAAWPPSITLPSQQVKPPHVGPLPPFLSDWSALRRMMSTAPLVFSKWLRSKTAFSMLYVLNKHHRWSIGVDRETELGSDKTPGWHPEIFSACEKWWCWPL